MRRRAIPICGANGASPCLADTLEHLAALGARCRDRGIDFGIGLTPFEIYLRYDAAARECLRAKVLELNETGADTLAILFDDMRGDVEGDCRAAGAGDRRDHRLEQRAGTSWFVLRTTPTIRASRASSALRPRPISRISAVCSIRASIVSGRARKSSRIGYSAQHLCDVAADLRRKPFIWDNHIANDAKTRSNHLYLDPSADSWSLAVEAAAGLAINPMNQPHLSRIALRGYRHLLTVGPDLRSALPGICRELAGPRLGELLREDLELLQNEGLSRLDAATRQRLLDRYRDRDRRTLTRTRSRRSCAASMCSTRSA